MAVMIELKSLAGLEEYTAQALTDWKAAGVAVAVVQEGWLRFLRQISYPDKWICLGG